MIPIQVGAAQIYSSSPQSLYFFTGPEYGVKKEYISALAEKYDNNVEEHSSLLELISTFKTKSLIPRKQQLFVVRYDKDFISHISTDILSVKIPGTIVCIYQDDKDEVKLDKVFPDNVLRLNYLTPEVSFKHLVKKFPDIPESIIKTSIEISDDFYSAQIICQSLLNLPVEILHNISQSELKSLFGYQLNASSERFKLAVAARDFNILINEIDNSGKDLNLLFYDILNTLLEIVKVLENSYTESYVKPYLKLWNLTSAKYMFDITYDQIEKLRNYSTYSPYVSLMYIISLLKFKVG